MAEENFYEMRDARPIRFFNANVSLKQSWSRRIPDYFSKYSMVTFREDLPYSVAKRRGNAQDALLMSYLCGGRRCQ